MMGIALTDEFTLMYTRNGPTDPPRLRIPTDAIADFIMRRHDQSPQCWRLPAIPGASMRQKLALVVANLALTTTGNYRESLGLDGTHDE